MKATPTTQSRGKLMAIGVFARVTGLTVAALRHYDEEGLLRPAVVDPASGYRYYMKSQALDAERIRVLRALEVPLDEIREFLREPDADLRRLTLVRHRRRVEDRMARDARALEALDRMEQGGLDPIAVNVRTLPARPIAYTRYVTSMETVETDRARALDRIARYVRAQGQTPGAGFSVSLDALPETPTPGEDFMGLRCGEDGRFTVDVGVVLDRPVEPGDGIYAGELPGGTVAYAVHEGRYEPVHVVYKAIVSWALKEGHVLSGLPRELYLVSPLDGAAPADYRTEIQVPIL